MRVTLSDTSGTLATDDFEVVCDALGLGGFRAVGELRLRMAGTWTFTVGDDAYQMDVA
jgi:hypothetical protein